MLLTLKTINEDMFDFKFYKFFILTFVTDSPIKQTE